MPYFGNNTMDISIGTSGVTKDLQAAGEGASSLLYGEMRLRRMLSTFGHAGLQGLPCLARTDLMPADELTNDTRYATPNQHDPRLPEP